MAACQLSRALGLQVLGTAGTPEGMTVVLNNGAHQVFNHREEDYTHKIMVCIKYIFLYIYIQAHTHSCILLQVGCEHAQCVCVFQEATEGRGVDVIVEMLSNVNLSKDLEMLAVGGRVMVSGTLRSLLSEILLQEDYFYQLLDLGSLKL